MLVLAACVRSASSPDPQPVPAFETPAPTPAEIPFPLAPASTWIYEYKAYEEDKQATWVITETILSLEESDGMFIAEVERLTHLQSGQPNDGLLSAPESGKFWYILRDGKLYIQTGALDASNLTQNTQLEMVFPPESVPCWYTDTDHLGPLEQGASGCRYVSAALPVYETPAGSFENCLELLSPYLSGGVLTVFCPNVGFVAENYRHMGSPFGHEIILTGYSLQSP